MQLLLATTNLHKIREFKDIFKGLSRIEILSLHQFPEYIPPEETGATFKENASLKALHAAQQLNCWVLADDSGLCVPALHGEPGVNSRRYAGKEATDQDNRQKLLQAMSHLDEHLRNAYYACALAIANPEGIQKVVEGTCEGLILSSPKGRNGFGYDSLFLKNDYEKTFAELDESTKNKISHRRKAFERLLIFLETMKA